MTEDGETARLSDGETRYATSVSPSLPNASSHSLAESDVPPHEARNFWILVIYQVVLRAGWIFKTESVVMPHAADALDPSGLARGWLPLLNRFGQSVPPVLAARRVKDLPQKPRAFRTTQVPMAVCFLGLTSLDP